MNNLQPRFGRTVLVSGKEALLAERAVDEVVRQAQSEQPDAGVYRLDAGDLDAGKLAEATGSSLFAEASIVVINGLDELDPSLFDQVETLARDGDEDLALVVVHPGGNKGSNLINRLKKLKVEIIDCPPIKAWELPQFAVGEVRRRQGRIDQETAGILVESLGHDVRAIAAAVKQLLDDTPDGVITTALVRRYFAGRADVTSFTVADAVMDGRRNDALGAVRWALENNVPAVLVTSAMAAALRDLGKYMEARDGRSRDADIAKQVGVAPWKVKNLNRQLRNWSPAGIAASLRTVARVDAEIKGAASDPGFSLEQMVIEVSGQRGRGR